MKHLMTSTVALAAALAASGCATNSASTPPVTPPVNRYELGDAVTTTFDPAANTVTVQRGATSVQMDLNAASTNREIYLVGGGAAPLFTSAVLTRYTPNSSAGLATVYYTDDNNGALAGAYTTRNTPGQMPTAGSAMFTGDYTGFRVDPAGVGQDWISGDATLNVDFANATIDGVVANRSGIDPYADLILETTALSPDGSFAGATSGGNRIAVFNTTSPGNYGGFVLEQGGSGLVGAVGLDHSSPVTTSTEYGAFYGQ